MNAQPLPNVPLSPITPEAPRRSSSTSTWIVVGAVLLGLTMLGCVALVGGFFVLGARQSAALEARHQAVRAEAEVQARDAAARQAIEHAAPAAETKPSPR